MAEEAKVKVELDTSEAEAKAEKLRKKAEKAEKAASKAGGGTIPGGRPGSTAARLRAARAGAAAKAAKPGVLGTVKNVAARLGPIALAAEASRRTLGFANATVGGSAGEFAQAAAAFGLLPGTVAEIQGQISGLTDSVGDILSGKVILDFIEAERLKVASLVVDLAAEGEELPLGEILGDAGTAFARAGQRDRRVRQRQTNRRVRGHINALKYGVDDAGAFFRGLLGGP